MSPQNEATSSLIELDAVAAVTAMTKGDISAEHYARALLNQAHRWRGLNAFRTLDEQQVLEAARNCDLARASNTPCGALHGLPLPVKDSIDTRVLPTSNGTLALRDFRPQQDAAVLRPLFAQGAILMGKTNLHELSRGYTSNNQAFGAVRNPHHPDYVPGGSSGGSGAAVAARIAPLAVAEDTLGSIRVPASMCGIVGLRPTHARYPGAGIMSLTLDKLDQVGPLARSVRDLALFDSVVTGDFTPLRARALNTVRLGIANSLYAGLDTEAAAVVNEALQRVRAAGAALIDIELPAVAQHALTSAGTLIAYENMLSISKYLRDAHTGISFEQLLEQMSPNLRIIYETTSPPSHELYEAALRQREEIRAQLHDCITVNAIDALAFPPILAPPPPLGDNLEFTIGGETVSIRKVMGRNTSLGSVAGLASLVMPTGLTQKRLPVGLEFAASSGRDRALLSLGLALEPVLGPIPAPELHEATGDP